MNVAVFSLDEGYARELSTLALSLSSRNETYQVSLDESNKSACGKKVILNGFKERNDLLNPNFLSRVLQDLLGHIGAPILLLDNTRLMRSVASMLSSKMNANCITDCYNVTVSNGLIHAERNVFSGRAVSKVYSGTPCILNVRQGYYKQADVLEAERINFKVSEWNKSRILGAERAQQREVNLKEAKIIVSIGRGIKKKEDIELIRKLSSLLNATIGCSRPISSDLGWLPEEHHIGLTGVSVKPDLYFAIGISGQLQHVAGIKDSKVIAAINIDKSAPIFQYCDYGVVGDLYAVVPEIIKILSEKK